MLSYTAQLYMNNEITNKSFSKKKNSFRKYFPSDIEEGQRKGFIAKELRKKRKKRKTVPQELTYAEAETVAAPIILPKEPEILENGSPTACYKCYRKKERRKRAKRQIR